MKRLSTVLTVSLLLILSAFVFVPDDVVALSQTYLPNVDGHELDWAPKGGGSHYVEVDDPVGSPDGDTTYVLEDKNNAEDYWGIEDTSESGTITNLRVYARLKSTSSGDPTAIHIYTGGVEYVGSSHTLTTGYVDYYDDWATNPGGGDWTWAQIDALEIGLKTGVISGDVYCTQSYAEVTYTASAPASITVTLRKSDNTQERIDVGFWGNTTVTPGSTEQNSTNFVRVQCDNCDGVDDSFWVNWSGTTWSSANTGDSITIDSNFIFYYYETTSGTADPDDGGWSWSDSGVDADGNYQITFTNSGTTYVWVRFRIETVPSPLSGADDFKQDYTVELDR